MFVRYLNIIAYFTMIYVNYTMGFMRGSISIDNPLFVPAPFTFSIWGLIYGLLFLFVIYQALPAQKNNMYIESIGYIFVLTALLNILWLYVWNRQLYFLSWVVMVLYFFMVGIIYLTLDTGLCKATMGDRLFLQIPFSVYFGWIMVALFANTMVLLRTFRVIPYEREVFYTIIAIVLLGLLAGYIVSINHDIVLLSVIIWALVGIFVRHYGSETIISIVTAIGIILFGFLWLKNYNRYIYNEEICKV